MPLPQNLLWTGLSLLAFLGAIAAVFAWWLIRLQQKKVPLPILKVLYLQKKRLRPIRFVPPPLIPFLSFMLLALFIGFLTLNPTYFIVKSVPKKAYVTHILVDFSPSVSRFGSVDSYLKQIRTAVEPILGQQKLTLSSTHSAEVFEIRDTEGFETVLSKWKNLGFHRAGSILANALEKHLAKTSDVEQLTIISDSDSHSLEGLNLPALREKYAFSYIDIAKNQTPAPNIFIQSVQYISTAIAKSVDWQAVIAQSEVQEAVSGTLDVFAGMAKLASVPWTIPKGALSTIVNISWVDPKDDSKYLSFRLHSSAPNSIVLDDEYFAEKRGGKQIINIVADILGEHSLDDPASSIKTSFEVLGFEVRRYDELQGVLLHPNAAELTVIFIDENIDLSDQCPGAEFIKKNPAKSIWLVPAVQESGFKKLCACFAQQQKQDASMCEGAYNRKNLQSLMFSSGAEKVGGHIGATQDAIAWAKRFSTHDLLLFTVPLRPNRQIGLNHVRLPLLISELLKTHGWSGQNIGEDWPKIADNSESRFWNSSPEQENFEYLRYSLSNVCEAESKSFNPSQTPLQVASLPPKEFDAPSISDSKQETERASLAYFQFGFLLVFGVSLAEITSALFAFSLRRKEQIAIFLAAFFAAAHSFDLPAITLTTLGTLEMVPGVMPVLAAEVIGRTSLEMEKEAKHFTHVNDEALSEPWLWTRGISSLIGSKGNMQAAVQRWIKRGGFLVIDDVTNEGDLNRLVQNLFTNDIETGVWEPIPVKHEILKSFYLIDALPNCNSGEWRAFTYDKRLAILAIPFKFFENISSEKSCSKPISQEDLSRAFVNILMVTLTTDYKNDQIHIDAILKRLQ